jgi:Ca2+-binding EF-hand superfamily protein
VLDRFHISPTAEVVEKIFGKYDHDGNGRLSFDEFVTGVIPADFDEGIEPEREHRIRSGIADVMKAPGAALAASAADNGGALLLGEAAAALRAAGRGGDDDLMRLLKDQADESPEGLIPAAALARAVAAHEHGIAGAAVKAASRDFIDGFGRGEIRQKRANVAAHQTMSLERVEQMLREKVQGRSKGGPMELRRAFVHFDKERSGFIGRDALAQVLHHFHLPLRPGEIDALMVGRCTLESS